MSSGTDTDDSARTSDGASGGGAIDIEGELRRLNWALEAFRRSSTAFRRARKFPDLAQRVCEALVEGEAYALACVGLAETSAGKPIRIVASAGAAIGYVEGLKLSWSKDIPEGRGPSGIAIRSAQPHIMADSRLDPTYAHWKDRGDRFGIRSSVTVPFVDGGRAVGALLVYALVPNAFGSHELEVFQQLAEEFAFAIALNRYRKRVKAAEHAQERAQEDVREARAEMMRIARASALGEFAASVAHEISQPLAVIVTSSDAALRWLTRSPPNVDRAVDAIRRTQRDAERVSATIQRLRALVANQPPQYASLEVNQLIRETLRLTRSDLRRAGISVATELEPELPPAWGDGILLQQALLNLLLNAIEAMRDVEDRPRQLIIRSRPCAGGGVQVEIEDRGDGLDAATIERIFDPFFTTKAGGTGLGLAIARSIVEGHGGKIWAAPAPSRGAVFAFTLPGGAGRRHA